MASKAKVKKTKVQKKKKTGSNRSVSLAPEFEASWKDSGIDLTKSTGRLLKLFQSKKKSEKATEKKSVSKQAIESPLVWFVDSLEFENELKLVSTWHRQLTKPAKLVAHAAEVLESVKRLENLVKANPTSGSESTGETGEDQAKILPKQFGFGETLTLLGAAHSIRLIAGRCEHSDWNGLVTELMKFARDAESNVSLTPDVYQWLAIELPIAIAILVPELEDHLQIAQRACQKMALSLADMLDNDGWPHARYSEQFGKLSASWIRCGLMARKLNLKFDDNSASQLEWVVRQVVRCLRPNGTVVFSKCDPSQSETLAKKNSKRLSRSLVYSLGKLSVDSNDKRIVESYLDPRKARSSDKLPSPCNVSEWGSSLVLRSNWSHQSPMVALDFSQSKPPSNTQLNLEVSRSMTVIAGSTMPTISINGVADQLRDPFEVVCEQSDADVEYVELEAETKGGVVINRQLLLSPTDEFLMIADAVRPPLAARIGYRCRYPLANGIVGMRESENRELYLRATEIQSLVLPLALSEWKGGGEDRFEFEESKGDEPKGDESQLGDSEFGSSKTAMVLSQTSEGFGLYAPLFFDLNPTRSRKKRTWRQLTVGEDREAVPADVACAYRIQLDEEQWFLYRAIAGKGNRTFLGENFSGEFLFNSFSKSGKVKTLIMI